MRKNLLFILLVLFCLGSSGQTIVSTVPESKRVVIEDYSGVMWESPYVHKRIQFYQYKFPDQVYAYYIHEGDNAIPGSNDYLDLRTPWGAALLDQTSYNADYFTTTVNRHVFAGYGHNNGTALYTDEIQVAADMIMLEPAYVNVAAEAEIDADTRVLTVHCEVYYTGESPAPTNYLNVALVQNEIVGWQVGRMYNPNYCTPEEEEYREMAVLRHLLTDQFGDEISPTSPSTFIDRTYTYTIPEEIGDVGVDLTNLEIIVFVAESNQEIINGNSCIPELLGSPVVKIESSLINACEGETIQFNDLSMSNVTSRSWSFPGGTPSSSTEASPVVYYASQGEYDVTLSVTNVAGTSEETFENYVEIDPQTDTYCLDFEGWEASHWVVAPYASSLIAGTDHFSITCWVLPRFYVDDWTRFGGIVGFREFGDAGGMSFYILQLGGTAVEARIETEDDMFTMSAPDGTLELYEYHHLALTYDGAYLKLYKNAELLVEMEATGLYGPNGNVGLSIGGALLGNYTGWTFDGEIDEVTVWTKALSEAEVEQYMCIQQDPTTIDGLALYYDFSECGGSNIVDDKVGNYQGLMLDITDYNRVSTSVCEYTRIPPFGNKDDLKDIQIYPNPASNVLNITKSEGVRAEILSMTGQLILSTIVTNGKIDISSVPDGFYVISLIKENTTLTRKISIRK